VLEDDLPEDTRVLNCSRCNRLLMARGQDRQPWHPEFPAARVYGRPVCRRCLPVARSLPMPPENRFEIPTQE
jgi:hypothetical protein